MKSDDVHLKQISVDGQIVYEPDADGWRAIFQQPWIDSYSLDVSSASVRKAVEQEMEFVRSHSDVIYVLSPVGTNMLLPCILLKLGTGLQRVALERLKCEKCGLLLFSLNPTVAELYFGVSDKSRARENASRTPRANCPNCQASLPRYSIWTSR